MLNSKPIVAALFLFTLLVLHVPGAQAQVAQFNGKPDFSKGSELGYFVWGDGATWKVRWTTTGAMRSFWKSTARPCPVMSKSAKTIGIRPTCLSR